MIYLYITYEIKTWQYFFHNGFTLRNSLFLAIKLTKNADSDKRSNFGYDVLFDIHQSFSLTYGRILVVINLSQVTEQSIYLV